MESDKIMTLDREPIKSIMFLHQTDFVSPTINFDRLKPKEKVPDFRVIPPSTTVEFLSEFGLGIFCVALEPNKCWAKRQRQRFYLRLLDLPQDKNAKKINKLPVNHVLEVDIANRKVRLVGPFIFEKQNYTEWLYY